MTLTDYFSLPFCRYYQPAKLIYRLSRLLRKNQYSPAPDSFNLVNCHTYDFKDSRNRLKLTKKWLILYIFSNMYHTLGNMRKILMHCYYTKRSLVNRCLRFYLLVILLLGCGSATLLDSSSRSFFRPIDPCIPELTVKYVGDTCGYKIRDSHIEPYPTFAFGPKDFQEELLPSGIIPPVCETDATVSGDHLRTLIANLITQVRARKNEFTDFVVIQRKNFNRKRRSGLLVLKAKNFPYVIKLFMETPKTFTTPFGKGVEPITFFYMAGGTNRHLSGITRIKNRNYVEQQIANMPEWKDLIYLPRKWMWVPDNEPWLDLTGINIGTGPTLHTQLPSVYVIVCDAVDTKTKIKINKHKRKKIIMQLCNDLDLFLDPNPDNYVFQPANTRTGYHIAVLDTEHFPTIAGFKQKVYCKTHVTWYGTLISKCLGDMYFRTRKYRRNAQQKPHELANRLMHS